MVQREKLYVELPKKIAAVMEYTAMLYSIQQRTGMEPRLYVSV
jgi:hypothetical protein